MTTALTGLVLMAALLHASWNALLKGSGDRAWTMTVMETVHDGAVARGDAPARQVVLLASTVRCSVPARRRILGAPPST